MEIKSLQFYTFFPAAGQKGKGELFLCIFWGYYLYPYAYVQVMNKTLGRQNFKLLHPWRNCHRPGMHVVQTQREL